MTLKCLQKKNGYGLANFFYFLRNAGVKVPNVNHNPKYIKVQFLNTLITYVRLYNCCTYYGQKLKVVMLSISGQVETQLTKVKYMLKEVGHSRLAVWKIWWFLFLILRWKHLFFIRDLHLKKYNTSWCRGEFNHFFT